MSDIFFYNKPQKMILWQRVGCLYLIMSTSRWHLKFYCVLEVEHSLICKWDSAKFGPVIRYNCLPTSGSGIRCDLRVIKVYFPDMQGSSKSGGNANIWYTSLRNNPWFCESIKPLLPQRQGGGRWSYWRFKVTMTELRMWTGAWGWRWVPSNMSTLVTPPYLAQLSWWGTAFPTSWEVPGNTGGCWQHF